MPKPTIVPIAPTAEEYEAMGEALIAQGKKTLGEMQGVDAIEAHAIQASLAGDPSFMMKMAAMVAKQIITGQPDNPARRMWLVLVLEGIRTNHQAANALCGKNSAGAPKKGARGFDVSFAVFSALYDGGAVSVEDAWAMVAEEQNLDISTVKKYWTQWRPKLAEFFGPVMAEGGASSFSEGLKTFIKNNRGN